MDGNDPDALRLTIGELARRTGLTVKTIRWYSDPGLVPPAGRTAACYRLYGVKALARLELVRTLRRSASTCAPSNGFSPGRWVWPR